ncbi:alpha-L-arabinofuranosidase [Microbacterium sp. EYE_5]|uniref:arabinosylfuranosidase ArfA n=1 Tax=unclassified Microbacterium TaxID=2609290 RepID=UPI002002E556|nr:MULTISPECIES: alpha-L-arabinofuranosidase C-terminal domain-containing protein [unclassified Microbacterium]MCK6079267.1 alpha-L-arabinofuranosidase [Microbacterium sp. EYE_382]MCK6084537.1 alpha-L-arabinofuranosidase [Microbacterium sp. EYE_384]MCK6123234.1 alpha-L-arabinofuranosidase [Microbacterium sp. EYE_80]MCK6125301.1 alpha-L-arabinofuranosidase [Microbacterium sp. EYE_79]MCK6140221.1 alpha-L-arabinofuranosidase [Microbacterium sp. EYE_39]
MTIHGHLDPRTAHTDIDRRIFGGFVEHLGRHIYDGIHEPSHPSADADGFRQDVVQLVRELGVSTIRYPGGNFVSGYRWEDGVGPREQRPRRLDLAWHSTETNEVGLHEFAQWLDLVGSDLMLAVNLGTRGTLEALDLLEYANADADTAWTRQRAANGAASPFGVRMWCLGNEMDGPWQLGHRNADDYGKLAAQTAKAMRQLDPSIELVVCGSSGSGMPTFGSWERTVLEHTFDDVDFISCHSYYQERGGDAQEFLASGIDMSRFIESVVAVADAVAATKKSDKRIMISFDEWNVWYLFDENGDQDDKPAESGWPVAPRLLEDRYHALDAVVFGDLLITLLQHADRVRSASLAQLVNVIAPIMTEPGGPAWRQTTFFPFSITSRLAGDRVVRLPLVTSTFTSARFGEVPTVNAVATLDDDGASVFVVNRSVSDASTVRIDVSGLVRDLGRAPALVETHLLHEDDMYAANTLADPERVGTRPLEGAVLDDGVLQIPLPPVSWAAVRLA